MKTLALTGTFEHLWFKKRVDVSIFFFELG